MVSQTSILARHAIVVYLTPNSNEIPTVRIACGGHIKYGQSNISGSARVPFRGISSHCHGADRSGGYSSLSSIPRDSRLPSWSWPKAGKRDIDVVKTVPFQAWLSPCSDDTTKNASITRLDEGPSRKRNLIFWERARCQETFGSL